MTEHSSRLPFIKVYHGYGHKNDLLLYGHLLTKKPVSRTRYSNNVFINMIYLLRLFFVKPVAHAQVELHWQNQVLTRKTEADGFIKFEWSSVGAVPAGWHSVQVRYKAAGEQVTGMGELFVPHKTQYAFISDIDDTIMVSHSATVVKRLQALFFKHPRTRSVFTDTALHYRLLSLSNTSPDAPNPFFYVSSSEWNLYDYLLDFFSFHQLPKGAFLLNHIKRWTQLLQTGKTKHEGKLIRVARILQAFPQQQFVLIGDNTQRDPTIYTAVAEKYAGRIHAIYIRNVHPGNEAGTQQLLQDLQTRSAVHTCLFNNSAEAIAHSKLIGLIT